MTVYPTKLERMSNGQLLVEWNDGQKRAYRVKDLRDHCSCATCRERHSSTPEPPPNLLPIISEAEARPLTISGMKPVGNYAYSIEFSDGHDTGIYTLEFLREFGQLVE